MAKENPENPAAFGQTDASRVAEARQEFGCPGRSWKFEIGVGVTRTVRNRPYERDDDGPLYRPLRIFTMDPAESRLNGSMATVDIPYEPLDPGPVGAIFEIDDFDGRYRYTPIDLDAPRYLIQDGALPSASRSNPEFHQQMTYAVASLIYSVFRTALGRHISWGFREREDGNPRLIIRPHAMEEPNAFYDKDSGELRFGYFRAKNQALGRNIDGAWTFTCLSHDIICQR